MTARRPYLPFVVMFISFRPVHRSLAKHECRVRPTTPSRAEAIRSNCFGWVSLCPQLLKQNWIVYALSLTDCMLKRRDSDRRLPKGHRLELARALRAVDRACMLAFHLQKHSEHIESRTDRTEKAINRPIAICEAIQKTAIQLPPLRSIEEREEYLRKLGDSVLEIARLAGPDPTMVNKWLGRLSGSVHKKQQRPCAPNNQPFSPRRRCRRSSAQAGCRRQERRRKQARLTPEC